MANITADYSVTPGQLRQVLKTFAEINQPVMVWGRRASASPRPPFRSRATSARSTSMSARS